MHFLVLLMTPCKPFSQRAWGVCLAAGSFMTVARSHACAPDTFCCNRCDSLGKASMSLSRGLSINSPDDTSMAV